jgi:hypothetical protein
MPDATKWKMTNIMVEVWADLEEMIESGYLRLPNPNTWINFIIARELANIRDGYSKFKEEN